MGAICGAASDNGIQKRQQKQATNLAKENLDLTTTIEKTNAAENIKEQASAQTTEDNSLATRIVDDSNAEQPKEMMTDIKETTSFKETTENAPRDTDEDAASATNVAEETKDPTTPIEETKREKSEIQILARSIVNCKTIQKDYHNHELLNYAGLTPTT